MKAAWISQFRTADGRVYEADTIRIRDTPYVRVQADVYSVSESKRIYSTTTTDATQAQRAIHHAVEQRGFIAASRSLSLQPYEPEDVSVLFAVTRDYVARWYSIMPRDVVESRDLVELAGIGTGLTAVDLPLLQQVANTEAVQGHQQLILAVTHLTDMVIWELRQRRAAMLDPTIRVHRSYTRSILATVAALETVKHLQPHYALRPPAVGTQRAVCTLSEPASVIDMFAWKRSRTAPG